MATKIKQPSTEPDKIAASKARCQAQGGTWNAATNTCTLPERTGAAGGATQEEKAKAARQVTEKVGYESHKAGLAASQKAKIGEKRQQVASSIQPIEQPQPTEELQQPTEEPLEIEEAPGVLSFDGIQNLLSGRPISIGGKTYQTGLRGTVGEEQAGLRPEVLGGSLPLGVGAAATTAPSLAGQVSSFLNKLSSTGKVAGATKATGVLTAPVKAAASSSVLKTSAATILGFAGLGSLKGISTDLLTAKVKNIETETGKLGEQITKIPETSNLGFSLDEAGKIYEYSPQKAFAELEVIEQTLIELETALQTASVGQTVLKITGKYQTAQAEIDKQRRELDSSRAKVLNQIINPPEALLNSRDFFRGSELLE